ncbi:MAG: hypothetical protein BWK79_07125 [Beggiatoa sp. IS2]|nr:MAG: hypothetical protein BWK79_07125 [Beggiatoa sp. IS2]
MKVSLGWSGLTVGIALAIGVWQFSQTGAVYAPGWLTEGLLRTAWVRTQTSGRRVRPWPWANTWPLARLTASQLNFEQIVLAQANEEISPFALGHLDSSVLPGEIGNSILRVHRNTYFDFLRLLKDGDALILESLRSGRWYYQVSGIFIVDKTNIRLLESSLNRRLTLVSCYPCTDPHQDSLRYVVVAEEVEKIVLSQ